MAANDVARFRANWQDEIESAALYQAIAAAEPQPQLAEVYRRLAAAEESHAQFWEQQMRGAGQAIPPRALGWRTRTLIWLARRFGPQFVLPTISTLETADSAGYGKQSESRGTPMPGQERLHARLIQTILTGTRGGLESAAIAQIEGRHRAISGNALRAAVLGASDGLLSNFSLVMGVAGADLNGRGVLIAGTRQVLIGFAAAGITFGIGRLIGVSVSG